ncbi:MAG: radical SAM protein [Candidatus Bathyarchaeia archaeon]
MKYILEPHVILRSEPQYYNTYAAFHWERAETRLLEEDEFRVMELIYDEPLDVDEIASPMGMRLEDCKDILNGFDDGGFVTGYKPGMKMSAPKRVDVDPGLFKGFEVPFPSAHISVDIFITSRCNLRCRHCFSNSGERREDIPLKKFRALLDEMEALGVFEVRLNGGEPLAHPSIKEILLDLSQRRLRRVMITNGTLLNHEKVDLLKSSRTIPTVSLDDSRPEGHDALRGVKGAFKRTLRGMRLLEGEGIEYGINTCLHRGNLARAGEIVDLAARYGASRIALLDLKDVGRMREHGELIPSPEEYRRAAKGLQMIRSITKGTDVSLDLYMRCNPLRESMDELRRGYVTCSAGKTRLSIDSDGGVYPCNLVLSDPKWLMGSIRERSLKHIWLSEKMTLFQGRGTTPRLGTLQRLPEGR